MPSSRLKILSYLYLLLVLIALGYLISFGTRFPLQSSVLSLLPSSLLGEGPSSVNEAFLERLNNQVVFLVSNDTAASSSSDIGATSTASAVSALASASADSSGSADSASGVAAADYLVKRLQDSSLFESLKGKQDDAFRQEWGRFYFEHNSAFVNDQLRASLEDESIFDYVLAQAFSPFSGISHLELASDPLLLTRQEQIALSSQSGALTLAHDYLVAKENVAGASKAREWFFIYGTLKGSSFSYQSSSHVVNTIDVIIADLKKIYPNAKVLKRGAVFFSNAAAQSSKYDVEVLGSSTIILVFILLIVCFRSLMPLFAALSSITCGLILGLALTVLVFGELFSFTLVMSLSLIGLSCDYTLYYMTVVRSYQHGVQDLTLKNESEAQDSKDVSAGAVAVGSSFNKVRLAILAACLTTVVAYALLIATPFPGVKQMAVFAVGALLGSCAFVLLYSKWWALRLKKRDLVGFNVIKSFLGVYETRPYLKTVVLVIALSVMVGGAFKFHADDDVKKLSAMPYDLKVQDDEIARLTGQSFDQKWLLVYARSDDELLEKLNSLQPILDQAKAEKIISDFKLLPLNSISRQQADYELIKKRYSAIVAKLEDAALDLDYKTLPPFQAVSLKNYINSAASEGYNMLVISPDDNNSSDSDSVPSSDSFFAHSFARSRERSSASSSERSSDSARERSSASSSERSSDSARERSSDSTGERSSDSAGERSSDSAGESSSDSLLADASTRAPKLAGAHESVDFKSGDAGAVAHELSAAIVPVYGVSSADKLVSLISDVKQCVYVDIKSSFDKLFSSYRLLMTYILAAALCLILGIMMIRFGIKRGFNAFLPCLFSIGVTVGLLSLLGFTFNLFSILALLLVLGVGINYPIFFTAQSAANAVSFYGITVAMLTTEFTLGILSLSSTEAVRSFGITLCLGVFIAYITSPLSLSKVTKS